MNPTKAMLAIETLVSASSEAFGEVLREATQARLRNAELERDAAKWSEERVKLAQEVADLRLALERAERKAADAGAINEALEKSRFEAMRDRDLLRARLDEIGATDPTEDRPTRDVALETAKLAAMTMTFAAAPSER